MFNIRSTAVDETSYTTKTMLLLEVGNGLLYQPDFVISVIIDYSVCKAINFKETFFHP